MPCRTVHIGGFALEPADRSRQGRFCLPGMCDYIIPEGGLAVRTEAVGRDHLVRELHLQLPGRYPAEVQFLPVADELDRGEREDNSPDLLRFGVVKTVKGVAGHKKRKDRAFPFWLVHQGLRVELNEEEFEALLDPRETLQRNGS